MLRATSHHNLHSFHSVIIDNHRRHYRNLFLVMANQISELRAEMNERFPQDAYN